MDDVIDLYRVQFYTPLLVDITALACFVVAIVRSKAHPGLRLFWLYGLLYALMDFLFLTFYYTRLDFILSMTIIQNWDNLITIVELLMYFLFFLPLLKKGQRLFLIISSAGFTILFIYLTIRSNLHGTFDQTDKNRLYTIQSIILIVTSLFYFRNLSSSPETHVLSELPSFWITTGILSLSLCVLPFSIAEHYVSINYTKMSDLLFATYNIFNSINFLLIIRAFLCKTPQQRSLSFSF